MSVSHSSKESEIISLDAGLRMDGFFALGVWDFGHRSSENGSVNFTRDFLLHVANEILRFKVND